MLNKNVNCYNIENNFKCSVSILHIWQLKCQQRHTNKTKNGKLFICKLFRIIQFFFLILLREATLESKVASTNRNSSAFLLHTNKTFSNVELFSIFSQTFLELIFATKIKTMLLKQSVVLFTSCQRNIAYIMSEHLKYCTQIKEYWLNKNACLNIV